MKIINTSDEMLTSFENGHFDIDKWNYYIDRTVSGARKLCTDDMHECIDAGYSWQNDYLPVLDKVFQDNEARIKTIKKFSGTTDVLEKKMMKVFHKTVDADIILYLGLCNGAGWATKIHNRQVVLLGIEKIMELGWYTRDNMTALIFHELGHVYHKQHGLWIENIESLPEQFLWQLFREGIAMIFEQDLIGDSDFYQQDINGWKSWCDSNFELIRDSFNCDIYSMDHSNQRYFGDWVSFEGYGDTGYYLGTRFVRFLLEDESFDNLILYDIKMIKEGFDRFLLESSS